MINRTEADNERSNSDDGLVLGVLGLGHAGLPTALGLAEMGWPVLGADVDKGKTRLIARGEPGFHEPGLSEMLLKHLDSGRFRIAPDVPSAVRDSNVVFICVGTPPRADGSADLSQVESVARTVAQNLNGYKLVVQKSTAPVSTASQLKRVMSRYVNGHHDYEVAVNPEFLKEGKALHDFLNPDRIVLGVESERAREILLEIYRPLLESDSKFRDSYAKRLLVTDLNTAEVMKHAANAFLATKISFINMMADLCSAAGADVDKVARGLGMDPRIGPDFLQAGVGYGGNCLPKDLSALVHVGEDLGADMSLLRAVSEVNDNRVNQIISTLRRALWILKGKVLAVWGLSFKPGTDDIGESPSLKIVPRLVQEGALLRLYDPVAMPRFQQMFPEEPDRLVYCDSAMESVRGADAIVLLTDWPELADVDLAQARRDMAVPVIVDGRNFLEMDRARELGFEYYGMGR